MIQELFRIYKKIIVLVVLLVCALLFWFFGCRKESRDKIDTSKWQKIEEKENGTSYQFETNGLKGSLTFGTKGVTVPDKTLPVVINVQSEKSSFDGLVKITMPGESGKGISYQSALNCKKGVHTRQVIEIPHLGNASGFVFEIADQFENIFFSETVNISDVQSGAEKISIGILGETFANYSYMEKLYFQSGQEECTTNLVKLNASLPTDVRQLEALSMIIIDQFDTSRLSKIQLQTLLQWVEDGGKLILGGGVDHREVLSGFQKEYGIEPGDVEQTNLKVYDGENYLSGLSVYYAEFQMDSLKNWKTLEWITPESIYVRNSGKGKVTLLRFSLSDNAFVQWMGRDQAMKNLLEEMTAEEQEARNREEIAGWYMQRALYAFRVSQSPNLLYYSLFFILYLFVLGIIAYDILKEIKRREYIWFVVPILAVLFTLLIGVRSIINSAESDSFFSGIQIEDTEKEKNEVYLFYQNKDGQKRSLQLNPIYQKVEPVGYNYGTNLSNLQSTMIDYMVNDTKKGKEIEISESVPGLSQLMKITATDAGKNRQSSNFRVKINGDYTKFRGTIENVSSYRYKKVLLIRGTQYVVLSNVKSNSVRKIKGSDVRTWSYADAEISSLEQNQKEDVLHDLLTYLEQSYILEENKLNQLIVIGITDEKELSLFEDTNNFKEAISVDVNRYKIFSDSFYENLIADINRQCLDVSDENLSLKNDLLQSNQTEAVYQFEKVNEIKMLKRNSDTFEGSIFAYNYNTDKMETILTDKDDSMNQIQLKNYLTKEGKMKIRYILPNEETYGSAPVISLLYE